MQPKTARVIRAGTAIDLPVADVGIGDLIEIRPGERIPVDGVVTDGDSHVDESMISGEPMPVAKTPGAALTGGTVNQAGALTMRATAVGGSTVLAQIIRMVEEAQGGKLPIQQLVDRVTLWFVPAVMVVAAGTFVVWLALGPSPTLTYALVNAVAVLIIACPCAMGLATPTSIMVGTGRGSEIGILFRRGEALQSLQDVTVVAFDKTGTLTEGRPAVTDIVSAEGFDRETVLSAAAAVEARSEHPLGRAIIEAAKAGGLEPRAVSAFSSRTGSGISGMVGGQAVLVGNQRFMDQNGVDASPLASAMDALSQAGKTPVLVAIGGKVSGVIAVTDPVRESAPSVIRSLHEAGIGVAMVTGDNRHTAQAIARQLGIDDVVAEVLPGGKVDEVRRLKAKGKLAFVGDGINDAPALAEADVGIAVGTGTDIAIESADIVLVSDRLDAVADAIVLSRAVMGNIRQNLFWAFAYNVVLIPVAAGVLWLPFGLLLSPVLAAGAMALSSVFVVTNALRLRRFEPAREVTR